MTKFSWTNEQKQAIDFPRQANLLVSAAAGSGKTTVLAERIIRRAISGEISFSRLLVMTFTDLAAKQMHNKIESRLLKLRQEARDETDKRHLDTLLRDLPRAQISTIHSFCNRLLSEYLAEYKDENSKPYLEPGYSLMDEETAASLLEETLDKLLSVLYTLLNRMKTGELDSSWQEELPESLEIIIPPENPLDFLRDFERLGSGFAPGLSDDSLRSALLQALARLRSLGNYRDLACNFLHDFVNEVEAFPSEDLLEELFEQFFHYYKKAAEAIPVLKSNPHYDRLRDKSETGKKITELSTLMDKSLAMLDSLSDITIASRENFNRIVEAGRAFSGAKTASRFGGSSEKVINNNEFSDLFNSEVFPLIYLINDETGASDNKRKQFFPDLQPVFCSPLADMQADLQLSIGTTARFFELVLALDREFQKEKYERNLVEFSDFEHGAFNLLSQAEISREVKERYDEIYIDEYQDTSSIQDQIVSAIAKNNIFMVGDVKQSIYRFRYANPMLFQKRADQALPFKEHEETEHSDYLLELSINFRSRGCIIDFVNEVFSSFMTRESAEIEYDQGQRLYTGRSSDQPGAVSWLIANHTKAESGEETADDTREEYFDPAELGQLGLKPQNETERLALLAADKIRTLLSDGARLQDIALLCCTNQQCKRLRDSLEQQGIPVTGNFGGIYPENLVVRQFEALLNVLDNPRQDIPLATFLASPFAGSPFLPEEFIRLRQLSGSATDQDREETQTYYFHEIVFSIADMKTFQDEADEKIRLKLDRAVKNISRWRLLARERAVRDLLSLIIEESNYEQILESSAFSSRRLSELQQFLDFVKDASVQGFDSVQKLLRRLKKLRQRDLFPDDSELQADLPAVRVLTYHRSKGLEWPYVFLLGLDDKQLKADTDLIALDENDGIRSYSFSADGLSIADNLLNRQKMENEAERARAEAWRRLYVGMTRAGEELFLLSEFKGLPAENNFLINQSRAILAARPLSHRPDGEALLPAHLVRNCKSYADILWSVLILRYPDEMNDFFSKDEARLELPHIVLESGIYQTILEKRMDSVLAGDDIDSPDDTALILQEEHSSADIPEDELHKLIRLLSADLPDRAAAFAPSKLTVSELKRAAAESLIAKSESEKQADQSLSLDAFLSARDKSAIQNTEAQEVALTLASPEEDVKKPSAAERGTYLHSFIRFLDLAPLQSTDPADMSASLKHQMLQMIEKEQIPAEAESVLLSFFDQLAAYAQSDLARRVLQAEASGLVYREMPFTMAVSSDSLSGEYPHNELTLIQGMIDLWFVDLDDKVVLVDFKSDRLPPDQSEQDKLMQERYALQLNYYAEAIEKTSRRTVKEKLIWLLRSNRAICLE